MTARLQSLYDVLLYDILRPMLWCHKAVAMALQGGCYGVTGRLLWCYRAVAMVLQGGCYGICMTVLTLSVISRNTSPGAMV